MSFSKHRATLAGQRTADTASEHGSGGRRFLSGGFTAAAARCLPQRHFCLFERGANHSLFSRYDSPQEDKFWLPTPHIQDQATVGCPP